MRVDPRTVSTHGFIINIHAILLGFADPFVDKDYTKVRRFFVPVMWEVEN